MMNKQIEDLYRKAKEAFDQSEIKSYALKNGYEWHYSLMSTKISIGAPLILGYNYGAAEGVKYKAQSQIPSKSFGDVMKKNDLGSFSKVYNSLIDYCPDEDVHNFMMSNFCYFRSKSEGQISGKDLDACMQIFEQLIQEVRPSKILGFSAKLRNYIKANKLYTKLEEHKIQSNKRTLLVSKGKMNIADSNIPFFMLPHPNSHFTGEARAEAWSYCFSS